LGGGGGGTIARGTKKEHLRLKRRKKRRKLGEEISKKHFVLLWGTGRVEQLGVVSLPGSSKKCLL